MTFKVTIQRTLAFLAARCTGGIFLIPWRHTSVFSALIDRGMSKLGSTPALLRHKEPARLIQSPLLGAFCLLLAGSLRHKGAYNRTFPCMEANYPYAIKNQRGASKKPLVGGFGCEELVLYGIRDTGVATLWTISTNESQASLNLDQWEWTTLCSVNTTLHGNSVDTKIPYYI